ncbi:MAG: TetR/AcrR family transcriptional regulator [Pseudomonadota bacterium]
MTKILNLNYIRYLSAQIKRDKVSTKGERTCNKIKLATAQVIDKISYKDLRVVDICNKANISAGTFYIYFKEKKEVTVEVLTNFVEMYHSRIRSPKTEYDFKVIQSENMSYLQLAKDNPGLISCFLEVGIEVPELAKFHQQIDLATYTNIVERVMRVNPKADFNLTLAMVYALGSMMDEVARRLVLEEAPMLNLVINNLDSDIESYCECLSIIWYRTLFGRNPKQPNSDMAKQFLNNH